MSDLLPCPVCGVDGCEKPKIARGLCDKHYRRLRKHGSPDTVIAKTKPGEARDFLFNALSGTLPEECLIWTFAKKDKGYGTILFEGKMWPVHRLALSLWTGIWHGSGSAIEARHGPCHNPSCFNPKHMKWGTRRENALDRKRDGTQTATGQKLTDSQVLYLRSPTRTQSLRELARVWGLHETTLQSARAGRTFKNLAVSVGEPHG